MVQAAHKVGDRRSGEQAVRGVNNGICEIWQISGDIVLLLAVVSSSLLHTHLAPQRRKQGSYGVFACHTPVVATVQPCPATLQGLGHGSVWCLIHPALGWDITQPLATFILVSKSRRQRLGAARLAVLRSTACQDSPFPFRCGQPHAFAGVTNRAGQHLSGKTVCNNGLSAVIPQQGVTHIMHTARIAHIEGATRCKTHAGGFRRATFALPSVPVRRPCLPHLLGRPTCLSHHLVRPPRKRLLHHSRPHRPKILATTIRDLQ